MQTLPGVANIEIDAKTFEVTVSGDTDSFVVDDAVKALEETGFPAEETENLAGA